MNKILHQIVFKNPNLNKLFYEFEKKETENKSFERIIISGLARSGTTSLLRELVKNDLTCSLKYENMPLILAPNMQKLLSYFSGNSVKEVERSHQDGIMINTSSSEAFDEVFFQVYERNSYTFKNHLNEYDSKHINSYIEFINHFLITNNRNIYVTKNNNHILRLPEIIKSGKFKIFITFRDPLTHASSLKKQDLIHSSLQKKDTFALDYMNFLGHFEFGLNKKYFNFMNPRVNVLDYDCNDFWLAQWINYYEHIITLIKKYHGINLINFDDWCSKDELLLNKIKYITGITLNKKDVYLPPIKPQFQVNENLLKIADNIFQNLIILYKKQITQNTSMNHTNH
jgi:hypothetical protein